MGVRKCDQGAVALEFALITPVLLLVMLLTIDVGRVLAVQIALGNGAKESVRALSLGRFIGESEATFKARVSSLAIAAGEGARPLSGSQIDIAVCGTGATIARTGSITSINCPGLVTCSAADRNAEVTVAIPFRWLTPIGLFPGGSSVNLRSKAVTLCLASN